MSLLEDSGASAGHSASVTTGQGPDALGNWMSSGLDYRKSNRLGNSRAPPPTCNIPAPRPNKVVMPVAPEQPWIAKIADDLMGSTAIPLAEQHGVSVGANIASGSIESTQDNAELSNADLAPPLDEADDDSQQNISDISDDDADVLSRGAKAPKSGYKRGRKAKEKKKVGRPIAYRGDPNAPELTDQERRRIKRRIANRESARRVRHKRQEELEEMQIKMEQIQAHNSHLQQHAAHCKDQKDLLCNQLEDVEGKYESVTRENKQLAIEIQALRQSLQLKMSALEDELDKRANEAENPVIETAFANPHLQTPAIPIPAFTSAAPGSLGGPLMDAKMGSSMPLDWFPSLNLDDTRSLDMVHTFFDEPAGATNVKKEILG